MRRALGEAGFLLLVGIVAAGILQRARTEPLPMRVPSWVWDLEADARWVDGDGARRLYERGDVVFVDAREPVAFVLGHVPGALNVPLWSVEHLLPELMNWAGGQGILVYGDGTDPDGLDDFLLELEGKGWSAPYLLVEGWEGWRRVGGEVAVGRDGLLLETAGG
jgi:hypothetical protein